MSVLIMEGKEMFGLFCDKNIKRIIKSIDEDFEFWEFEEDFYKTLYNEKNLIKVKYGGHIDENIKIKELYINRKDAGFLLTNYNKKYLIKALKRFHKRTIESEKSSFKIVIKSENPEDFI